jgi:hypothetical protein
MRRTLVAVAASAALLAAAPAAHAACHYVKQRSAKTERIEDAISARQLWGLPHSRALVRRLDHDKAAIERQYDILIDFPLTAREARYFEDRYLVSEEAGRVGRLAERVRGLSGGVSIEDDYPRGAYVLLRVTRRVQAARLRSFRRRAPRLHLRRVETSERALGRLQDVIDDDSTFQETNGIDFQSSGVDIDRNQVEFEFSSERPDAEALLRARYGRKVFLTRVPAWRPGCANPDAYRLEPDGRTLTVFWTTSGSARNPRVEVREIGDRVLIGAVSDFPPTVTADAQSRSASVTLPQPLAQRRVVSIVTRKAVHQAEARRGPPIG